MIVDLKRAYSDCRPVHLS